jgi:hypothetical protein
LFFFIKLPAVSHELTMARSRSMKRFYSGIRRYGSRKIFGAGANFWQTFFWVTHQHCLHEHGLGV